jgi:uncharacterized protein YggU (UPF0235/DUF167 family)
MVLLFIILISLSDWDDKNSLKIPKGVIRIRKSKKNRDKQLNLYAVDWLKEMLNTRFNSITEGI